MIPIKIKIGLYPFLLVRPKSEAYAKLVESRVSDENSEAFIFSSLSIQPFCPIKCGYQDSTNGIPVQKSERFVARG